MNIFINQSNWRRKRITPWLFMLTIFASLFSFQAMAAQAEATVSKNIVAVNEVFQLTLSVDANVNSNSIDFSVLGADFAYGQPSVSSSTSLINGTMSRSTTWTIALAAKRIGTVTIPAFQIGSSQTQPITITVLKNSAQGSTNATQQDTVRVTAVTNKNHIYVGESINYRVKILIGEQLSQASLNAPYGKGLTVTQVGQDAQNTIVKNGKRYIVLTRNYQITTSSAGNIVIYGAKFNAEAVRGSNGFNSGINIPIAEKAANINLNVKAKPNDYKGLWLPTSALHLQQTWLPKVKNNQDVTIKVGEPITRIITLKIKDIAQSNMPNISLTYPDTVRTYDEKPEYKTENGYSIMILKQVIIPRQAGKITLPPLTINWWNTQQEQQKQSSIAGLAVNVIVDPNASNNFTPPTIASPQSNTNAVVAPIKTVLSAGYWPWLTLGFAILWLLTLGLLIKQRQQQTPSTPSISTIPNTDTALEQAINANDPIKVQTCYRQWQRSHQQQLTAQPELQQQLDAEIKQMMAAYYSQQDLQWNNQTLLQLLKRVKQQSVKTSKPRALSSLDPQ